MTLFAQLREFTVRLGSQEYESVCVYVRAHTCMCDFSTIPSVLIQAEAALIEEMEDLNFPVWREEQSSNL